MIDRYDVNANGTDSFWVESELEKEGEWCKWEDVERLEKENAALVKRWDKLKDALITGCRSAMDEFESTDDFKYYHKEKTYKKVIEAMQDMEKD